MAIIPTSSLCDTIHPKYCIIFSFARFDICLGGATPLFVPYVDTAAVTATRMNLIDQIHPLTFRFLLTLKTGSVISTAKLWIEKNQFTTKDTPKTVSIPPKTPKEKSNH
ncbi:MAG: hypothetical protein DRN71_01885 [Candidatus Nanohalarchaeota archaeon]|nr:MAG: hypothetical protein DRN71_01885 [Candidatus Nanohaloarchaeota archaeon]